MYAVVAVQVMGGAKWYPVVMRGAHTGPVVIFLLVMPHGRASFDAVAEIAGDASKLNAPLRVCVLLRRPFAALAFAGLAKHLCARSR